MKLAISLAGTKDLPYDLAKVYANGNLVLEMNRNNSSPVIGNDFSYEISGITKNLIPCDTVDIYIEFLDRRLSLKAKKNGQYARLVAI